MSETFTVYRSEDSSNADTGLSLADAADALLTHDGYSYEVRADADGYHVLWISDGSANSPRGAGHMQPTILTGWSEGDVWKRVIATDWRGMEAMTDADFAAMIAEAQND